MKHLAVKVTLPTYHPRALLFPSVPDQNGVYIGNQLINDNDENIPSVYARDVMTLGSFLIDNCHREIYCARRI